MGSIAAICNLLLPPPLRRWGTAIASLLLVMCALALAAAASEKPGATAAIYSQAMQLKKSGRCDLAVPVFESAMQSARCSGNREQELQVLRHRGECYQYQGDYALAWLDFSYGRLLVPEQALFYEALGWLAIFEGHYPTAQAYLEHAQHLSPLEPWVQLNLGWAYYLQGHTTRAFTLWRPLLQDRESLYRQALKREIKQLQNLKNPSEVGSQISFEAVEQLLKTPFSAQ